MQYIEVYKFSLFFYTYKILLFRFLNSLYDVLIVYFQLGTELEPHNFVLFMIPIKFRRKNVNKNTKSSPLSASKQVEPNRTEPKQFFSITCRTELDLKKLGLFRSLFPTDASIALSETSSLIQCSVLFLWFLISTYIIIFC